MSEITQICECFIRPKTEVQDSERYYTIALDLLSISHSQFGTLYTTTSSFSPSNLFENLKTSLSETLVYFPILAGRFVTHKYPEEHSSTIFVDCSKGVGARLIHASSLDLAVNDVISTSKDVSIIVQSFFDLGQRQVNYDGHTKALLSLQLTELRDGFFIGCSINHCIADAFSVSHFINVLSQIFNSEKITRLPIFKLPSSLIPEHPRKIPYLDPDEFIIRRKRGFLRDRIFSFTSEKMKILKAKANEEAKKIDDFHETLSSLKALCGFIWISINRARKTSYNEDTIMGMAINLRSRLNPPLSSDIFGNFAKSAIVKVKVGELLTNGLGWATMKIHQAVQGFGDEAARERLVGPVNIRHLSCESVKNNEIILGGSPWLEFDGVNFGVGKPVAVRTGYANRFDGKLIAFPGRCGFGSVDIQLTLLHENMEALLLDEEFMNLCSY